MKPEANNFPTDDREARLTALLLGELTAAEAAETRQAIEQDPELAQLYDRLKRTIALVRAAIRVEAKVETQQEPPPAPAPQLSTERRRSLLAQFKVVPPKKPSPERPRMKLGWVPLQLAAVLVILTFVAAVIMPNFVRSRETAQANAVINNLRQLDGAKQQWALENKKSASDMPTLQDLAPYLSRGGAVRPPSVAGETYSIGRVAESPTAQLRGGKGVLTLEGPVEGAGMMGDNRLRSLDTVARGSSPQQTVARVQVHRYTNVTLGRQGVDFENGGVPSAGGRVPGQGGGLGGGSYGGYAVKQAEIPRERLARRVEIALPSASAEEAATTWDAPANLARTEMQARPAAAEPQVVGVTEARPSVVIGVPTVGSTVIMESRDHSGLAETTPETPALKVEEVARGKFAPPVESAAAEGLAAERYGLKAAGKPAAARESWDVKLAAPTSKGTPTDVPAGASGRQDVELPSAGSVAPLPQAPTQTPVEVGVGKADAEARGTMLRFDTDTVPSSDAQKVPILGDSPVLGRLFKRAEPSADGGVTIASSDSRSLSQFSPAQGSSHVPTHSLDSAGAVAFGVPLASDREAAGKPAAGDLVLSDSFFSEGEIRQQLAAASDSAHARQLMQDGRRLFEVGQHNEAKEKLGEAAELDPNNQALLYYKKLAGKAQEAAERGAELGLKEQEVALQRVSEGIAGREAAGEPEALGLLRAAAQVQVPPGVVPTPAAVAVPAQRSVAPQQMEGVSERAEVVGALAEIRDEPPAQRQPPASPAPVPQPEVTTTDNPFSTFSLNVSDVSFKLAGASLEQGQMPDPGSIRSEEFINAFDYRDPLPAAGRPIAFNWERARYPFAHDRDLIRLSVKTAALGREAGRPLNLVLCLDSSGSMERADRVAILREALQVLASPLKPEDRISVVAFGRTARLWVDGLAGTQAGELVERVGNLIPQGGTNLEEALRLAYETALRHYLANGVNRVVLLTDGAANLGDVDPASLKARVEHHRRQGVALDCFGIGWEGYNDELLEALSRNGDGRYGFVNSPEEAATGFAGQLAGALQVAASDVKVQVEFNPQRVAAYRQIGYAKHQLTKEQFRDNTVDAAEIGAAEAGNALYTVQVNPGGEGPLGVVRVRYKLPGTEQYKELEWTMAYTGSAPALDHASPTLRLAAAASAFSESLAGSPFAAEVTSDALLNVLRGVPEVFGLDPRPNRLEWMIRQAKSISGR